MQPLSNPQPQAAPTGRIWRPGPGPCPVAAGGDRVCIWRPGPGVQAHAARLSGDGTKCCAGSAALRRKFAARGVM